MTATRVEVLRVAGGGAASDTDVVAVEEPLEIRVAGPDGVATRVAVTMRTPGHDEELAVGFLRGEGLIEGIEDLAGEGAVTTRPAADPDQVVTVRLSRGFDASLLTRNFYATSSCGVCGKAALDFVEVAAAPLPSGPKLRADALLAMGEALRGAQPTFDTTGGLHATARFDADGTLLAAREDVGRHNAMDKVIGRALLEGQLPLGDSVLVVSGRASFELVQKAAVAGVPILCAVSAPSSLAVRLAERVGLTLEGFLRDAASPPQPAQGQPGVSVARRTQATSQVTSQQ
jgi:FdhD protein